MRAVLAACEHIHTHTYPPSRSLISCQDTDTQDVSSARSLPCRAHRRACRLARTRTHTNPRKHVWAVSGAAAQRRVGAAAGDSNRQHT
jgi:hypothetical protein